MSIKTYTKINKMSKNNNSAGKGSSRRIENFKQIQDNWSFISWDSKKTESNSCIFCDSNQDLVKQIDLFGEPYYCCGNGYCSNKYKKS